MSNTKRKIEDVRSPEQSKFKLRVVLSDITEDARELLAEQCATKLATVSETNLARSIVTRAFSSEIIELSSDSDDELSLNDISHLEPMSMNKTNQINALSNSMSNMSTIEDPANVLNMETQHQETAATNSEGAANIIDNPDMLHILNSEEFQRKLIASMNTSIISSVNEAIKPIVDRVLNLEKKTDDMNTNATAAAVQVDQIKADTAKMQVSIDSFDQQRRSRNLVFFLCA